MRPPEIEDDKIIDAGNQLLGDSRRVTGFALRKIVGGGNPSRLARVWEEYKRSQEVVESEPVQELPVEVEEALNEMTGSFLEQVRNLAQNLNSRAVKTAERRVADVMRSAKEQQENAEAELVDAAATVEDLEEQLGFVRAEGIKSRAELKKSQEEVDALRKKTAELERDLAVSQEKLSKEREQRKSSEASLTEVHGRNADLQKDKDDLRQERDELKMEFSKLQERIESIAVERDSLVKEKGEVQAQQAAQNERLESLLKQVDQLKTENNEVKKSHSEAAKKSLEFEVQAGHYKEQLDRLMARFSITESEIASKRNK